MDENSKLIDISMSAVIAIMTFIFISIACEPGERVTTAFERFDEELERCDWHLLPIEMQKMLYFTFLIDTQQPINVKCYGNIFCTRDTSKRVVIT